MHLLLLLLLLLVLLLLVLRVLLLLHPAQRKNGTRPEGKNPRVKMQGNTAPRIVNMYIFMGSPLS